MTNHLATLRDLIPIRRLTIPEALRIAELQAVRFRSLAEVASSAFPETAISSLPRMQVERISPAPSAGASQWSLGRWVIVLNGTNTKGRQRFSLAHEFKHVIDHPFVKLLYPPVGNVSERDRREAVCDYFAACLLMPRVEVKKRWTGGEQDVGLLARRFEVSRQAMSVRLRQLGLVEPEAACLVGVAA